MILDDELWERAKERWLSERVRSTPISQTTAAWNHLIAVLPHLRQVLEAELSAKLAVNEPEPATPQEGA